MKDSKLSRFKSGFRLRDWRAARILSAGMVIVAIVVGGCWILLKHRRTTWTGPAITVQAVTTASTGPSLREITDILTKNQTITDALGRHGLAPQQIFQLVQSTRPVYNLARVAAGHPYWLYFTPAGEFHDFRYLIDDERYLTVYREEDRFTPVIKKLATETRLEPVVGEIEGSLFAAITDAGEQARLAEKLAEIFTGDIDFYTDIQPGDTFKILVEKRYLQGKMWNYGPILAASITNQKTTHIGFRFLDENGRECYYTPDGRSLRKSFLKSPLKFARISSRFSFSRFHPILKIFRPHLGVDYAAPIGTPVQAVAAGVVVSAGWNGDGGRMVRLRHAGGYETSYMHLSRIAVRVGSRVEQSDVVGYVGSSGLATGPHLDFRIYLRGRPVDPRKLIVPPGPPVSPGRFAQFAQVRDVLKLELDKAGE